MRILWHINDLVSIGNVKTEFVNEGWIAGLAGEIKKVPEIELFICYGQDISKENVLNETDGIKFIGYYNPDKRKYSRDISERITAVIENVCPDVIHIMGTEYPHCLSVYEAAEYAGITEKTVISIQGIISEYAKHITDFLPEWMTREHTLYDIIKRNMSVCEIQKSFEERGRYEIELIKRAKHVIGRTKWDKEFAYSINPDINYYYNGEILRNTFYEGSWSIDDCRKNSIFISQATYSIKGFHQFIRALNIIKKECPDTVVYVAGSHPFAYHNNSLKLGAYDSYCYKFLKKNNLINCIHFLGPLDADKMKEQYMKANVFVSPSILENSSNSIGEAMILGTPVVSSNVGGTKSIIDENENGLLFEVSDVEKQAELIVKIFKDDSLAEKLSKNGRSKSRLLHDRAAIVTDLLKIYNDLNYRG